MLPSSDQSLSRRTLISGLLLFSMLPGAVAQGAPEERVRRLGSKLICCCGCGDGLLSCNHVGCQDDARMIRELHEQIARESQDRPILQWFAAKYGPIVLAAPLRGGFDNVAWIAPPVVGVSALTGVLATLLRWRKRRTTLPTVNDNEAEPDAIRLRIRRETAY